MHASIQSFFEAYQERGYTFDLPLHENFPFSWYRMMREQAPIYYDEELQAWSLFRYEHIQRALLDTRTFSSKMSLESGAADPVSLSRSDPPLHQSLRAWINQYFTPRRVAALKPLVEEAVTQVFDPLVGRAELEAVEEIAGRIPVVVISRVLGVPASDRLYLKQLIEEGQQQRNPKMLRTDPVRPGLAGVRAYFIQFVRQRRETPQDDLISELAHKEIDGERLSVEMLASLCQSLYVGGHLTTINLLGNILLCLHAFPQAQSEVRENHELIEGTIEEVLRYCAPTQSFARLVTQNVEIGGQTLHAGQRVLLWLGSANHDERVFKEPERFDGTRTPNKHLGFGHGVHFCLGAPLARLEGQVTLRRLLEQTKRVQIRPGATLEPILPRSFYGLKELPMLFEPA